MITKRLIELLTVCEELANFAYVTLQKRVRKPIIKKTEKHCYYGE